MGATPFRVKLIEDLGLQYNFVACAQIEAGELLKGGYKALILPAMFSAYGTFLLRQFFLTIPTDLEDAARIDGCGAFGIYWHVILPLSKPALATLTTFVFLGSWNNYMWPLIVINSTAKKTLPIALQSFQGLYTTEWTLLMAASMLVMLPVLIVFILNQRFFVRGIVLTGLKA